MSEVWGRSVRLSPVAVVGVPEVVGDLGQDVAAEVARRYGARLSPEVRAVRVSPGFTPPERVVRTPYSFWGSQGAKLAAARRREEGPQLASVTAKASAAPVARPRRSREERATEAEKRAAQVAPLLAQGVSYKQISVRLGLTRHQVEDARRFLGRAGRAGEDPRTIRARRMRLDAAALIAQGRTPGEVATALGIKKNYVYHYLPANWRAMLEGASCAPI